ncbi:MAG: hypothetical protein WAQ08_01755 [Aquabacterium sp.]|jgi:hypothetical protein|uniref:hypothetical protein n=1 Tax=Aquabacterium sp. TaxID=1872578 RepID=UPI003BAFE0CF
MLRLSTEQHDWLQAQQRDHLTQALVRVLKARWPALAAKLGDRVTAFVDAALLQAARRGLGESAQAARYVNLWCVWGPAFDDKPGFEWATDILRDEHRPPGVKVQQLVLRSRDELSLRSTTGVKPEEFDEADAALESVAVGPGAAPWIEVLPGLAQPRQVCDMTAFDIALGDQGWRQEYRLALSGGGVLVNRAPVVGEPQRYRTDTPPVPGVEVAPRQVAVLAYPAAQGHKAWLHLRCAVDAVCDEQVHPRVELKSDAGVQVFAGQPARLIKTPLHCAQEFTPPKAATGAMAVAAGTPGKPGAPVATPVTDGALCRERPPRYMQITACTCGLRRAGAPLGQHDVVLSILPAEQWFTEIRALPQPAWQWPHQGARETTPPPRVRAERDGQALEPTVAAWQQGFARLGEAFVHGMDGWWQQLARDEVLLAPRLEAVPQLMHGLAAFTWGAREAITAQGSSGFLRAQLIARLVACATELTVMGELRHAGTHARVHLQSRGRAVLEADVLRDQPEPALAERLMAVKVTWSHPFEVAIETLAHPGLSNVSEAPGSKPGALVGEAGLRPRPDGQGWQWFFKLALEPCVLSLQVWDPVRGEQTAQRTLWPAITLVDWSAG